MPGGIGRPRIRRLGHRLPVWCFDLHQGGHDVLCVVQCVTVKRMVLAAGADKPSSCSGFNEHASSCADGCGVRAVEVVVSSPEPAVFNVDRTCLSKVHDQESSFARLRLGLARGFGARIRSTTNAVMRVVEGNVALIAAFHIHFDENGAGQDVGNSEEHVAKLGQSNLAWFADLYHRLGIGFITELFARSADDGPDFANDSTTGRNVDGVRHAVDTVWEIGYLAVRIVLECSIDSGCVVCLSVTCFWSVNW